MAYLPTHCGLFTSQDKLSKGAWFQFVLVERQILDYHWFLTCARKFHIRMR
jgi:hypothetical protein